MPNPNAIVSSTIRFDPPLDRAPVDMLRAEGGLAVELEGGRRLRLDPANPRSIGFVQVLDGLSRLHLPVYLEIDPVTESVIRLLIPVVARVTSVGAAARVLEIELDASHARHVLRLEGPDASELERELRAAMKDGRPVIVTEDDGHNIIDVRHFRPTPGIPLPPLPPHPGPEPPPRFPWPLNWIRPLLLQVWRWLCRWWWWFRCPSLARAQQIFSAMAATSCNPYAIPAPCIPFLYPDDGCWARAHEMCRLMINRGFSPRKVWIDHSAGTWLKVNTRNHPQCYVEWGWHVAPTLCVRGPGLFRTQRMVIDPSLFTSPVSVAIWKGVQGDANAPLTYTGADQFWHGGGTDPMYVSSNTILAQYRLQLQNRSNQLGAPPYANCP